MLHIMSYNDSCSCMDQRCANPKILSPHQSEDFDQESAAATEEIQDLGSAVSPCPH